ncbi:aromatic hydrocarbon utilization transcriptional regulator CatR [Geomicrobium sp. JCM 19037]|uniref:LysR family transcriptional regulator n=1 Tax=Geomicrobium sp. JCM 19037 TaxID=1460634 RepID=UPI00045F2BA4|nr:LysR substrate-binding domain-containing protein [Geomicrobium sp. JCM 19037]GAK02979.1 aromatic hydrocarbon utilization transcriptional regulator CatR [Geomicrobium sp. JCM 19037]
MELRHLRYFIAVAEELHFGNAAKKLKISQPPLSAQIKELEEELGVQLFERTKRTVALTEAGKYYYEMSRKTLQRIDKDRDTVQVIARGEQGKVAIGFGGSVVYEILPKVLKQIKKSFPKLELHVSQQTTNQQMASLKTGEIDIALLVPPVDDEDIHTFPFYREALIVCLPKTHPLAKVPEPLTMEQLHKEPLIVSPRSAGEGYFDAINALFIKSHTTMNISQYSTEQQTMVSLVAAEFGISFVPESTRLIKHENVVYRQIDVLHHKETVLAWSKATQVRSFTGLWSCCKR